MTAVCVGPLSVSLSYCDDLVYTNRKLNIVSKTIKDRESGNIPIIPPKAQLVKYFAE